MNTVLAAITANSFKIFADAIEAGQSPKAVAQQALKENMKVRYGYCCCQIIVHELITLTNLTY